MKNRTQGLLTIFIAIICIACVQDKPENTIILDIYGGTTVTMNGENVVRDITVTASEPVRSPLRIMLLSNAETGEVTFANPTIMIDEGTTSASTKITFTGSKFPNDTDAKKITVTASTNTVPTHFRTATTDFYIKGQHVTELPYELTVSVNSTTINTTDADGNVEILFTLSKILDKDLLLSGTYDKGLTINKNDITWIPEQIIIPKHQTYTTANLKVRQGVAGAIPLKFATTDSEVAVIPKNLNLTFTVDPFPDTPVSLCGLTVSSQNFVLTKTFTVGDYTLTPEHNLNGNYGYEDKTKTVTANVTEGGIISIQMQNGLSSPSDPYILAAWVDWNRSGTITDNEKVLYTTIQAPLKGDVAPSYTTNLKALSGTIDGKYNMRLGVYYDDSSQLKGGCGNINNGDMMDIAIDYSAKGSSEASIIANGAMKIYVDDKDVVKTFNVTRSIPSNSSVTLNLAVSSNSSDTPLLNSSLITIPAGQAVQEAAITFKTTDPATSGMRSKVTVKIVSANGIAINTNTCSIVYDVTYSSLAEAPPVKLCSFSTLFNNRIFTESFTVGDYTLHPKHTTTGKDYGYADMTDNEATNVKEGGRVSITYGNQDSGPASYISAAWVDWNKDGNVDNSEMILAEEWNTTSDIKFQVLGTAEGLIRAPEGTRSGTYIMRIGSSSKKNLTGGCGKVEIADMFDIKINYSN